MYYKQSNRILKITEPTLSFLFLGLLAFFSHIVSPTYEYMLLVFLVMIFSNRYGIYIAFLSLAESIVYTLVAGYVRGLPIPTFFYSLDQWGRWLFLFLVAVCCGAFSTGQRERYEDAHHINDELLSENEQLKETVGELNETRLKLKEKVLESDNQLSKIFHIFKALNHEQPEIVLDAGLSVVREYLNAKKTGIYYVGNSGKTLRLKLSSEHDTTVLPQTIFVESAPNVIRLALEKESALFRTREDPENAPVLVGPVVFKNEVRYLIVLNEIEFADVSSQNFELFVWLLKWMGDRLENAVDLYQANIDNRKFAGTDIFIASEFKHLLNIEKERKRVLNYPYVYFELPIAEQDLRTVDPVLKTQLREIDYVGYDMERYSIMILLPGTDEKYKPLIEKRLSDALSGKIGVIE